MKFAEALRLADETGLPVLRVRVTDEIAGVREAEGWD